MYIRVKDVKQPVETHVDTQRHVDQVLVVLLQAVVDAGECVDHLGDRQHTRTRHTPLLLECRLGHGQVQQIHWRRERGREGERKREKLWRGKDERDRGMEGEREIRERKG